MLYDVDQEGWGSVKVYGDSVSFNPSYMVIHWGGGTRQVAAGDESFRLRVWQKYHMGKGFRDIAYNYAVGDSGTIYRCRGMNEGGHTKQSDETPEGVPYNAASVGVVWIGGKGDSDGPSEPAKAAMRRFYQTLVSHTGPVTVKTHREAKIENGSWTECPGADWVAWVDQEEYMSSTHIVVGVEDPRWEPIAWDLFYALGGVVDPSKTAAQNLGTVPGIGTNPRMYEADDAETVAKLLGLTKPPVKLWPYGWERNELHRLAHDARRTA